MNDYFASSSNEGSALISALVVGAMIWLASYLWKQYHKPNKKLPPLDNRQDDDLK